MKQVNQPLINFFNQNGLVFVMTNFKNPWNQTNSNDLTNSSNLLDVITNGHPANTNFNKELDSLALGFSQLQDSNVTVIFRPFHEMNGNWFWWGSKTSTLPLNSDYTALWNYTFNYLTIVKDSTTYYGATHQVQEKARLEILPLNRSYFIIRVTV